MNQRKSNFRIWLFINHINIIILIFFGGGMVDTHQELCEQHQLQICSSRSEKKSDGSGATDLQLEEHLPFGPCRFFGGIFKVFYSIYILLVFYSVVQLPRLVSPSPSQCFNGLIYEIHFDFIHYDFPFSFFFY